jgi:histidine transport system permease protein
MQDPARRNDLRGRIFMKRGCGCSNLAGYGPQIFAGTVTTVELSLLSLRSPSLGLLGAFGEALQKPDHLRHRDGLHHHHPGVPDLVLMLLIFYSLQIWMNDATDYLDIPAEQLIDFEVQPRPVHQRRHYAGFHLRRLFYRDLPRRLHGGAAGQLEAARAFGMKPMLVFRRILFPQMMRYALPGLGNNWQVILKGHRLVSLIGLTDVVKAAQNAGEGTFRTFFFMSHRRARLSVPHHDFQRRIAPAGAQIRVGVRKVVL